MYQPSDDGRMFDVFFQCLVSRFYGLLKCVEHADTHIWATQVQAYSISPLVEVYTCWESPFPLPIPSILPYGRLSEVLNPIVRSIPINVVYKTGFGSMVPLPDQAVNTVAYAFHDCFPVSIPRHSPHQVSLLAPLRGPDAVIELAIAVIEAMFQLVLRWKRRTHASILPDRHPSRRELKL